MSQENVEIVRRIFEGWSQGDFGVEADVFHPDIEYAQYFGPDEVVAQGAPQMRHAWAEYLRNWDEWKSELEEVVESGDRVVALCRIRARGKHSQAEVEIPDAAVAFMFRDGKIVRLVPSDARQKPFEAVGLSE